MASKSAILAVKIIGDAKNAVGALGKTGLAAGAMGAAVVAAGAVVGKGLYDIGARFDDVSDTIAIGTGASGEALDGLVDSAKNVGTSVPVDFEDAGEAIASLNTYLGATGKPLEDMTGAILDASRMLGEDGVANADAFGKSMAQWQRPAEDGADMMDTLFFSTQKYGIGLGEQIGHLNTYGSVLQNAGFTMEEAASLFGQLESGGISVSRVMPGLNKSFRDWASEGKDVQAELLGTVDAIENAESSTEALGIATDVFGAEGAQRLTTAIRSGKFDLEDLSGALDDASGSVEGTSEATRSASEEWTLLTNNAVAALEPLGSLVFGLVGDAFGALADWIGTVDFTPIEQFAETVAGHLPDLIAGFGDLVTGASPLTGILDQMWPAVEAIGAAFMDAMPTILEFGESLLPLIGEAIGAVIPLLMDIAATAIPAVMGIVEQVLPIVQSIFEAVIPAVIGALEDLIPKILSVVDPVMEIVSTILDWLAPAIEWLLPLVVGTFENLVTVIGGAIDIIVAVLEAVADLLKGDFSAAWDHIKDIVGIVIETVKDVVDNGLNMVASFFGTTRDKLISTMERARDGVVAAVSNLVSRVVGFFTNLVSGIVGRINSIRNTVSNGFNAARLLAVNAFTNLVNGVTDRISTLYDRVRALPRRIKSALGNLGSLLRGAGRDLIQGLINGIGSMGRALGNKARDLAGGAVDSIKQRLGIASPSKVMQEVGQWTGEGLILGIDRMQRDAARSMAGLVTVPDVPEIPLHAQPAGPASQHAGAGTTNLTINLSGVVGDRSEVRRVVEEAVQEAARRTGRTGLGGRVAVA